LAEGAVSYYWQRRGRNDINSNATGRQTNTLTLNSITPDDNGQYRCVAENKHGKSFTNYAVLTIEGIIVTQIINLFIIVYNFLCHSLVGT